MLRFIKQSRASRPVRLGTMLLTGVACLISAPLWLSWIGSWLVFSDALAPVDAIVPLAGSGSRVYSAAKLLQQGYAQQIIITNMAVPAGALPNGTNYAAMTREQTIELGVPEEQVVIDDDIVRTTYGEIESIRRFAEHNGIRSIMIVTSPYHTRRARLMADELFAGSRVSARVVSTLWDSYDPTTWWRWPETRRDTLLEYSKLLLYFFGYHRVSVN